MRSSRRRGVSWPCAAALLFLAGGCARKPPPLVVPPPPDPLEQLRRDLDTLIERPGHQRGIWGVAVHSLARDERLYARHPDTLLVPGSTMKIVSLAAAADAVGWDYTFETRVLAAGPIADGALRGDLAIVGSGDPSVWGRPGGDGLEPWVEALRGRGITRIEGSVVADDDAQEEPKPGFAWSWEDLGYTYGAMPGALNIAENTIPLRVSPARMEGLPAIVEPPPHARDIPIVNAARTGAAGTATSLWPELRPGQSALTINGTIAAGEPPVVLPVSAGNPTEWFARTVRNHLLAAGIDVAGRAVDVDELPARPDWNGASVIHTHRSPPLGELAKPLLKDSINLYAEAVLRLAAGPVAPTIDAGLDAVRARLESWGIPKEGIQIVDGSGLSRRNVIAPSTLLTILRRFHDERGTSPFMQALAVAGRDGTLASRMKGTPAEGNAIAKTGSLSNVRTLAGYVATADGERLAFAIMANNFEGPAAGVTATIDRLVARLASFSRTPRSTP